MLNVPPLLLPGSNNKGIIPSPEDIRFPAGCALVAPNMLEQ
jgi:hypothetical protein